MHSAHAYHVKLPMQFSFGHLAAMRRMSDSLMLQLDIDGHIGLGECAPRSYVTGETSETVCQSLLGLSMMDIVNRLRSVPAEEILHSLIEKGFEETFGIFETNNLICLLELSILDWLAKKLKIPGHLMLVPDEQPMDDKPIKVSQVLDQSLSVEEFLETRAPFHFIKIKGCLDRKKDIDTVKMLRHHLDSEIPIMIDANMNWQFEEAVSHLKSLRDVGVNWVEEPLAKHSWEHIKKLREQTGMPIMLDESVSTLEEAKIAIYQSGCDAINIRVAKCGGLLHSMQMIRFAREHGIAFQIGVQVAECGPLINASRILAANNLDAMTVESGQFDRFFSRMVVNPVPEIDRKLNVFSKLMDFGLGLQVSDEIERFKIYSFEQQQEIWVKNSSSYAEER